MLDSWAFWAGAIILLLLLGGILYYRLYKSKNRSEGALLFNGCCFLAVGLGLVLLGINLNVTVAEQVELARDLSEPTGGKWIFLEAIGTFAQFAAPITFAAIGANLLSQASVTKHSSASSATIEEMDKLKSENKTLRDELTAKNTKIDNLKAILNTDNKENGA